MASPTLSGPPSSTRTSKLWSTEVWKAAADAYSKGYTLPKVVAPVQVSPDCLFKSAADVQKYLGLDAIPDTKTARLVNFDASYNDVENGPEISYVLVDEEYVSHVISGLEYEGYRRIMLDGKARYLYSPIRDKTEPASGSD